MSEFWIDFRLNRRFYLFQIGNLILATIIGIRLVFPQAIPSLAQYIPDPAGLILEVVTILLIVSPVLDWFHKPRINLSCSPQTPIEGRDDTLIQIANWGDKIAENANIRIYQGFFESRNQIEVLEAGRLLPQIRKQSVVRAFNIRFRFENGSEEYEIRWHSEKKVGPKIIEELNVQKWDTKIDNVIGIIVTWQFAGRQESFEERFQINQHITPKHPRLERVND